MSHLKADDDDQIVESNQFTAPDYKGDDVEWVAYAYTGEVVAMDVGVEVTNDSYTKIREDGQTQTIFYSIQRFYKLDDVVWYELKYDTVRKTVWDAEAGE